MRKKWLILYIGVCLYVVISAYFTGRFLEQNQKYSMGETVYITEETVQYGKECLTVDICMPVVSGLSDAQFERSLNYRIRNQIMNASQTAKQDAEIFWQETKAKGYEPWPFIFCAGYEVQCKQKVLSLKVTTLLDNGGPGMPHTVYYNVDIKNNKRITLSDLFVEESPFLERIDGVIEAEMRKDIERYFGEGEYIGISKNAEFFINNGELYIAFAKYEVASGMTGEPNFLIPTDVIQDIIAPEYADWFGGF